MIKVAFIGNCQVDVYRQLINAHKSSLDVSSIEVWRLRPSDFDLASNKLLDYDLIVTQPLSTYYGPLALENLRATHKNVLTIHNIYFKGYHPDCEYIGPIGKRLRSPIGDYHSKVTHQAFEKGLGPDIAIDQILNFSTDRVRSIFDESADELRRREIGIDVPVTNLVLSELGWNYFFTFNHPTLALHSRYLQSIAKALGLKLYLNAISDPLLDHTHFPIYPSVAKALDLPPNLQEGVTFTSPKAIGGHSYDLPSFCNACYASYANSQAH